MKKLLSFLTAFIVVGTSALPLMSCSPPHPNKPITKNLPSFNEINLSSYLTDLYKGIDSSNYLLSSSIDQNGIKRMEDCFEKTFSDYKLNVDLDEYFKKINYLNYRNYFNIQLKDQNGIELAFNDNPLQIDSIFVEIRYTNKFFNNVNKDGQLLSDFFDINKSIFDNPIKITQKVINVVWKNDNPDAIVPVSNHFERYGIGYDDNTLPVKDDSGVRKGFYYSFFRQTCWDFEKNETVFMYQHVNPLNGHQMLVTSSTYKGLENIEGRYTANWGVMVPSVDMKTSYSGTDCIKSVCKDPEISREGVNVRAAETEGDNFKIGNKYFAIEDWYMKQPDSGGIFYYQPMFSNMPKGTDPYSKIWVSPKDAWKAPEISPIDDWDANVNGYFYQDQFLNSGFWEFNWYPSKRVSNIGESRKVYAETDNNHNQKMWSNTVKVGTKLYTYVTDENSTRYNKRFQINEFDASKPLDADGKAHIIQHKLDTNIELGSLYGTDRYLYGVSYWDNCIYRIDLSSWKIQKLSFTNDQPKNIFSIAVIDNKLYVYSVEFDKNNKVDKDSGTFYDVDISNLN